MPNRRFGLPKPGFRCQNLRWAADILTAGPCVETVRRAGYRRVLARIVLRNVAFGPESAIEASNVPQTGELQMAEGRVDGGYGGRKKARQHEPSASTHVIDVIRRERVSSAMSHELESLLDDVAEAVLEVGRKGLGDLVRQRRDPHRLRDYFHRLRGDE